MRIIQFKTFRSIETLKTRYACLLEVVMLLNSLFRSVKNPPHVLSTGYNVR